MALEIQSTIPQKPPTYSSVPQMNLGIYVAYAVTIYCYFMVSISGYWAFGNQVAGNVSYGSQCNHSNKTTSRFLNSNGGPLSWQGLAKCSVQHQGSLAGRHSTSC